MVIRSGAAATVIKSALHVGPLTLILALALTIASMVVYGAIWTWVLRCMGSRTATHVGITVFAGSGLASYAGSGAGAVAETVVLLRKHGICAGRATLLLALASLIGFCGAVIWAPWGLELMQSSTVMHALPGLGSRGMAVAVSVTAVCGFGSLGMLVLLAVVPHIGHRTRLVRVVSGSSESPLRVSLQGLLILVPCSAVAWLVGSCPLWLLIHAMQSHGNVSLPAAVGIQSIACVAGSVTFFLPSGLGARDGAITALLVAVAGMSLPSAAAVAILIRASDPIAKLLILAAIALAQRAGARVARDDYRSAAPEDPLAAPVASLAERVA